MLRYVARRLLLMIPTFVGITLLTFALLSLGEGPLTPGGAAEPSLGGRVLTAREVRLIREAMGYDLPALLNLDVEDARRTVQGAAERVTRTWRRVAPRLRKAVYDAAIGEGLTELEAASLMDGVARHVRRQVERGRESVQGLFVVDGRGAHVARRASASFRGDVLATIADMDRLRRLGGQTARWLRPVLEESGDDELLLSIIGDRSALDDAESIEASEISSAVRSWIDLARAEVAERSRGRDARQEREGRLEAEARLRRFGGLMMSELMPRLLEASHHVKALASDLIHDFGACDVRYTAFAPPGRSLSTDQARRQAVQDDRLERWWRRSALRYREVSGFERWAWLSWTRTGYAQWITSVLTLDFGESIDRARSVTSLIGDRLPITLLLQGSAIILMYLFAVPLGTWAAKKKATLVDRVQAFVMFVLLAAPSFWVATMCVLGLGGTFPMDGIRSPEIARSIGDGSLSIWSWTALWDLAWHCFLPVLVLSYGGIAVLQRFARASVLETLTQPWVRAARARGLPEPRLLRRHVLRPALIPLVTLLGVLLPTLVGGSVIVERIFGIPGMGMLAWEAVMQHDVPVVMAMVSLSAIATMIGYLVADLLYAWVDPRVRHR